MNNNIKTKDMNADKECFIVTPIGNETDPIRRHIDGLIDASLSPVLEKHGYKAEVAHRITAPGSINKQVINKLYKSDLVIANLTGLNPNVMYELAFRHSIRKPVIIIAEKGTTELPFDIVSERTIFYKNDFQGSIELREELDKMIGSINNDLSKGKEINNTIYDYLNEVGMEENIISSIKPEDADIYKYILYKLNIIENEISRHNDQNDQKKSNKFNFSSNNIKWTLSDKNNRLIFSKDLPIIHEILESGIGKKVRFREDGEVQYLSDIMEGYTLTVEDNTIEIIFENYVIVNTNVIDINYTKHPERVDIWINGDKTNRFNIPY